MYICEFTILVSIFVKLVLLSFELVNARLVEKDPFFTEELKIADASCLPELGQTRLLIADLKTLYYRKYPKLKSIRVKELTYNIGEDTDFMLPKDVELAMDFMSAAYLSCQ